MSSERESANLAFYAIVYSKGLVEKQQLQGALNRATLDGLPLETVLLEAGAIKPADCVEVLSQRAELGRSCRECEGVTYVLPDEDASTKKCEACGGRLRRSRKEEREARRTERKRRASPGSQSIKRPRPAGSSGGRELKALQERLEALEAQLAEQVHQAVDTRLAQEDLQGVLQRLIPEQVEQTLAAADLSGIVDRVSDEALAVVSARVDEADLSGLYDRVAEEALEKVSGRMPAASDDAPAAAPAAVDTQAIVEDATDQAAEQVLRSVRAELESLEEQAVAKASERALAMMQELKESSEEQAALAENSRLALEDMLKQYDLPTLTDRITEQVLQALESRESDEGPVEASAGPSPELVEKVESIDAAMQELLDEMVELGVPGMKKDLEALLALDLENKRAEDGEALEQLRGQLGELEELRASASALQARVDELVANPPKLDFDPSALRAELREEAVEVAVRKAISAVQDEVNAAQAQSEGAGLEGISAATEQVTAQVLQRLEDQLEAQSKQLADQAMEIIQKSLSAMDMTPLTTKVMNEAFAGVEERLSGLDLSGAGGGGGEVDMEAIKASVTEALLPVLQERVQERLDEDLAGLPDRIGQQAAAPVLQAIESRIEKLDLRNLPNKVAQEAVPVITEQVKAEVMAQVAELSGGGNGGNGGASSEELEKTKAGILEWVESRFAQTPPPEAIVQMATSKAVDSLEVRLGGIEGRLAELAAGGGGGGGGGGDVDAGLEERLGGMEVKLAELEAAALGGPAGGGGDAGLEERLGGMEVKLAELEAAALGGGGGGPSPDEVAALVQGQVLAEVEERLANLPAGGGGGDEGGDSAQVAELAAQNALAAVEARLADLEAGGGGGGGGEGGGLSAEQVEEIAKRAALEVGAARGASEELSEMPVPSGSSVIKLPGFERKFISLAKEVKNLRQTLTRMQAVQNEAVVSSPSGGGGGGGDLVAALNSPEFKQLFDTKINQVMSYMKSDVIPKSVKKIIEEQQ